MTTPAPKRDLVGSDLVGPDTPVLLHRDIHIDATAARLPLFGDDCWNIAAALPDRHCQGQAIHWSAFPSELRHASKLYGFALINIIDNPPRLPYSRDGAPNPKTIWACLGKFRTFTRWLVERGIVSFDRVTTADLDAYLAFITGRDGATTGWKRTQLLAVQRMHVYRDVLPEFCRLPAGMLWGGATAAQLAGHVTPWFSENTTPRIPPDIMSPLLSAALLTIETIAADLVPVGRRLLALRLLAQEVAPPIRREPSAAATSQFTVIREQLGCLLAAMAVAGHPLPGKREGRVTTLDVSGLAIGGWLSHVLLHRPAMRRMLAESTLPIKADLLRVTRFGEIDGRPWRNEPAEGEELVWLLRRVMAACYLTVTYLSGVRAGESLNLRHGCITRDRKLGLTFMSGQQFKAGKDRRDRSPETIPWVVTEQSAHAVAVMQALTPGPLLFPGSEFYSQEWVTGISHTRSAAQVNDDINEFVTWFNTDIAPVVGHPLIDIGPNGRIVASQFRRTLAWHIVRKPGGNIAGATQYGHLGEQLILGYAGRADAGFTDEIAFEQFLDRAEHIHDDHRRLQGGEHVSGPAAEEYRRRAGAGSRFAGLAITTKSQVANSMSNPDLQIHHGPLLTCVYRSATAACREQGDLDTGPSWPRCRLTCANIAYTDRDIAELRRHIQTLTTELAIDTLPTPLRHRIEQRLTAHRQAVIEHEAGRAAPTPAPDTTDGTSE